MKPSLLIVGLGNPGEKYQETRHNTGFHALDALAEAYSTSRWSQKQKFLSVTMEGRVVAVPLLLIKPTTYMNRSGEAVRKLIDFYTLDPVSHLLVISDDIDLEPGILRLRTSGGPGTHNGLKSLVDQFGESFPRLRIGIGEQEPGEDLSAYVLSKPKEEEKKKIGEAITKVPGMVKEFVLGAQ